MRRLSNILAIASLGALALGPASADAASIANATAGLASPDVVIDFGDDGL